MFGIRFIKFQPSSYVLKYCNGKIVKEGIGLSFFYHAPSTSLILIPLESIDVPFIFEELTSDFQPITIQGDVTYRIIDQKKIAQLLNFTLDSKGKNYVSDDPQKLPQRVINTVRILTKKQLEVIHLKEALKSCETIAEDINIGIQSNKELNSLGLEILGLSILAIKPNPETARALEAEAREKILKEADEAIYQRRNFSIEQERKIMENELNTEIAVQHKKKEIKETEMEVEKMAQQKQQELEDLQMSFQIDLEKKRKDLIKTSVENAKAEADAKAYQISEMMKAFQGVNPSVIQYLANIGMQPNKLIAIAFQELAEKADKIGQLNISPDLLHELIKGTKG